VSQATFRAADKLEFAAPDRYLALWPTRLLPSEQQSVGVAL